jgi:TPR repeat protein
MKKKFNPIVVGGLITIVVLASIVMAVAQDWQTGRNAVIELAKAELGNPEAAYQQGLHIQAIYQKGLKVQVKGGMVAAQREAIPWFEKAARKGHVKAMLALGDLYNTSAAEIDGDQAVKWYEKASAAGNAEARRKLAIAYGIGRGSNAPNNEKAIPLIAGAARAGDGEAELIYGNYLTRSGQAAEGEAFMLKAADKGVEGAHAMLGDHYYYEKGPLFNYNKALYHYGLAARAGDTQSQINLSGMYFFGQGTKKNGALAWMWLLVADDTKLDVRRARDFVRPRLTPAELADGEALYRRGLANQPVGVD